MEARDILIGAREARGVSQSVLARSSGVSQPSISNIERGRSDPTVSTLNRLLAPLDAQVVWLPTALLTPAAAASLIASSARAGKCVLDVEWAIKQLADDLAATPPGLRGAQCATPPASTGDVKYDAAIAALVEHRLAEAGLPSPAWVSDSHRFVSPEWLVCGVSGLEDLVRADTPAAFLRHGVLLSADDLVSV